MKDYEWRQLEGNSISWFLVNRNDGTIKTKVSQRKDAAWEADWWTSSNTWASADDAKKHIFDMYVSIEENDKRRAEMMIEHSRAMIELRGRQEKWKLSSEWMS